MTIEKSMLRSAACIAAFAGAAALPATAFAQSPDAHWLIRAGAFFPNVDTQARANGSNGLVGTNIDFETDLGLSDSKTLPVIDIEWRMAPNHRLQLSYLDLSRDADNVLKGSLTWQGRVYPISTNVHSEFDSKITSLTYLYSFYHTPETEVAAGIGLHNANLKAALSIVGGAAEASRDASGNAPLPVIALRASQRFTPSVSGDLRYAWFGIKAGDYDGNLNVVTASVAWFPWKNIGFEAGYGYSRYDIKVSKSDWNGEANYKFNGPMVNVVASF